MEKQPLLTIAVPTYNGAKTIRNMLDILLPQVTDEVEVLISDNCSNDETPDVIAAYRQNYPYIKCYKTEKNIGADGNFLYCMRLATGKYTMLISDDDIICEGAVAILLDFLKKHENISLAYLETVEFTDRYVDIGHCSEFKKYSRKPEKSFVTENKHDFFEYVQRQWGFTSSFLWNTARCQSIENPEQYFSTYWLQSYMHILCSDRPDDRLGVIAGPCIAAGSYGVINNYDVAKIEAIYYKKMLDFAVENGYDRKQLEKCWVWKVCFLGFYQILKERSIGKHLTQEKTLFRVMKKYPYAWIHLFPAFLVPGSVCRLAIKIRHRIHGRNVTTQINRPTD